MNVTCEFLSHKILRSFERKLMNVKNMLKNWDLKQQETVLLGGGAKMQIMNKSLAEMFVILSKR